MNKQALIETAILGLNRQALPAEAAAVALPGEDDASALLRALARLQLLEKAACPLSIAPALPAPDTGSDHTPCSPQSATHLDRILQGPHEPALEEFLDAIASAGKTLPYRALPALLERAANSEGIARKILPIAGSRGIWLAAQIPHLNHLFALPDPAAWSVSAPEERTAILRHLRSAAPDEGLRLLLSTWSEDGLRERLKFLPELEHGLSLADEPFLEQCLDDKRKEVRQLAARLLARLPGSALSARLQGYAESIFRFSGKDKREIHLPDALPPAWQRDGLEPSVSGKGGAKAALLRQLFSRIDPNQWEYTLSQPPADIIPLFEKSDWAAPILEGLAEAVAWRQNTAWANALLLHWNGRSHNSSPEQAAKLAGLATPQVFEQITIAHLQENKGLASEHSIAWVLLLSAYPWPETTALALIDGFRRWLGQSETQNWGMWHYRNLLKAGAYRCPAHLFEQLEKEWPVQSNAWHHWEKEVQFFLRGIAFRKEMLEAVHAPASSI